MWILQCFAVLIILGGFSVQGLNREAELYAVLFNNGYNPRLRPVKEVSRPVDVYLEFELLGIGDVSDTQQVFSSVGFIVAEWTDEFLQWTPAYYDGIDHLTIPPSDVWLPDIGIINSVTTFYNDQYFKNFRVNLRSDGRVIWAFGGNFETSCTLDMTYYPFDSQICSIDIINWAYSKTSVNLLKKTEHVVMPEELFSENGEWSVPRTSVNLTYYHEDLYPGQLFPKMSFNMILERKPKYYYINIVIPCIFVIVISLMVFWLPPDSGEKVSLGITALLAFSVFQLIVADNTPKTSDFTPLLSDMMTCIMAMATLSVISSIIVLYLYHHPTTRRLPLSTRRILFKYIASLLCMRGQMPDMDGIEPLEEENIVVGDIEIDNEKKKKSDSELAQILDNVKYLVTYLKSKNRDDEVSEEWKAAAFLIDRIFFWITLIMAVITVPYFLARNQGHDHL